VKSAAFSNLEGLDSLAFRNGVDIRPTLVRALTDLYVQKPVHTAEEERHYKELVLRLIDMVDAPTRGAIAKKLATYPAAPIEIIHRLAYDAFEIAEPILMHSPCLTGPDLLAIIQKYGARYAGAIAARGSRLLRPSQEDWAAASLPESEATTSALASDALDTSDAPPMQHIPATSGVRAELEYAFTSIRANSTEPDQENDPGFDDPGLDNPGLNNPDLAELFFTADRTERRMILSNLRDASSPTLGGTTPINEDAIRRLETAALQRKPDQFVDELQGALGIGAEHAKRIVDDEFGEPLLIAAKALGMSSKVLTRILLFLNPVIGQSVNRVFDLAKLYDKIAPEAALRLIAGLQTGATSQRRRAAYQPYHWDDEISGRRGTSDLLRRSTPTPASNSGRTAAPQPAIRREKS
jgi:hypothetical protein